MTDTCTCSPDDCHGGHTINVGPSWVCVSEDRLRQLRDDPFAVRPRTVLVDDEMQAMAAELLALRARVTELEAEAAKWKVVPLSPIRLEGDSDGWRVADPEIARWESGPEGHDESTPAPLPPDIATAKARIAELEADHARLVEDVASTVRRFSATLDERDALRARVAELEADSIDRDFGIQAMSIAPGESTLSTTPTTERARNLVLAMSLACGRMLDEDQAPNYVEFEVSPANHAGYVVHVRRAEGRSPHTLRRDAEARAERAEARVAELEGADREHARLIEYLHYAHGIEIDREDDDFREWQQQYGEVADRG